MTQRTPTLAEVIRASIEQRLSSVHVSLPGKINKYDVVTQKAEVQPLLKRPLLTFDDIELDAESLPPIPDVPVVFPRGGQGAGAFFVTWPLKPGDLVNLIFSERSLDIWLAGDGAEVDPVDFTMHNLTDAVAYPGLYPFSKALADADSDNMAMGLDGGVQIHITPDGLICLGSKTASDALALASKVKAELDAISTAFSTHTHTAGSFATPIGTGGGGGPVTGASGAAASYTAGEVKSDVVKAI